MASKFIFLESMEILTTIPQYHTVLEAFLVLWLAWYFTKRRRCNSNGSRPTDEEVERKLAEWQPEPLVPDLPGHRKHPSLSPRNIGSRVGKRITIDGQDCLNLGSHNYLSFLEEPTIQENAEKSIKKYGVGSCGPRGFYGTVDVHLELEERLAKFTNTEEAVVYSYGFSTVSSAISAYCKRNDVVFADERVHFALQKGLDASRSTVKFFKHNDVQDFQRLLEEQAVVDKRNPKKASRARKFLVVEGIYMNTGEICPLPQLVSLCRKHKLRIFLDESISLGTLGASGKGLTEYYRIPRDQIDMIIGSLEYAIGSVGGFCVGTSFVIEHQRLSGLGYCFSASLPPLLASAAIKAIDLMEENSGMFKILEQKCIAIHEGVNRMKYLETSSFEGSVIKHLCLKDRLDPAEERNFLGRIADKCIENKLAMVTPVYLQAEKLLPRPSLRLCVSVHLTEDDISFTLSTLEKCSEEVFAK